MSEESDLFNRWRLFLLAIGWDLVDADIYVLALKQGVIRSSDVIDEFPQLRQTTALARLKNLSKKGYLEIIQKETKNRRPYAMEFRVVHPTTALKDVLKKSMELTDLLDRYEEHWEVLAESPIQDSEIWLSKSAKVAIGIGASMLNGAKQEIKIYCHDCSWFGYFDIKTALENALANNVSVSIIADGAQGNIAEKLIDMGVSLYACGKFRGPPFCIIDNTWLFLPTETGALTKKYSTIRTNDKYLVGHFTNLFDTALGCSKQWGK